jgi:hypothetical protein
MRSYDSVRLNIYTTLRAIQQPEELRNMKTRLALQTELGLALRIHGAPCGLIGSLAVVTNGRWLPRLIESLKVETVETPVKKGAETVLVEVLGVGQTTLGSTIVSTNSRGPSGLAVPDLGHFIASNLLNVSDCLVHIIEVNVGSFKGGGTKLVHVS